MTDHSVRVAGQCRDCGAQVGPKAVFCGKCFPLVDHNYWIRPQRDFLSNAFQHLICNEFTSVERDQHPLGTPFTSEEPNALVERYAMSYVVQWMPKERRWNDSGIGLANSQWPDDRLTWLGFEVLMSYFRVDRARYVRRYRTRGPIRFLAPSELALFANDPELLFVAEIDGKLRLVSFDRFESFDFEKRSLPGGEIIYVPHVRLIDVRDWAKREALDEFEYLINSAGTTEKQIHRFLELHPEYLLVISGEYQRAHSHPEVWTNSNLLIPDFYLEKLGGLIDILELKRPQDRIVVGRQEFPRFSQHVSRAFAQLREYHKVLADAPSSESGAAAFKVCNPTLILLIGRSTEFVNAEEKDTLLQPYHGLRLFTYDEVAAMMRRRTC